MEEIKAVLALMHRHRHVFEVPARMRACAECGEWEQVLNEYRKVQAAVGPPGAPRSFVLGRVEDEARAAVRMLEQSLRETLQHETTPPDAVVRAVRVLQRVEADVRPPPDEPSDHVAFYLESRRGHAQRRLAELRSAYDRARGEPQGPGEKRSPADPAVQAALRRALARFPGPSPPGSSGEGEDVGEDAVGGAEPHAAAAFLGDSAAEFGAQMEALWGLFGPRGTLTGVERPPPRPAGGDVGGGGPAAAEVNVLGVLTELLALLEGALDAAFADMRAGSRPWPEVGGAVLQVVGLQARTRALPAALPAGFLLSLGALARRALKAALSQVKEDLALFAALLVDRDDPAPRRRRDGALQLQTTALPARAERLIRAAAAFAALFSAPERDPVARAVEASLGLFAAEVAQETAQKVAASECQGSALLLHAGNMVQLADVVLPRADRVWLRPPGAAERAGSGAPQAGGGGELSRLAAGALTDATRRACACYARERSQQPLPELLEVASAAALAHYCGEGRDGGAGAGGGGGRGGGGRPEAVRGAVLEVVHSVVELHAEVHLHAPPCLELVLPAVVEARWEQLASALQGSGGAADPAAGGGGGPGGAQLLLELSYLEAVLAGVMTPAAREVCRGLRAPLLAAAGEASSGGPGVGGLQRELERTQLNWLCLAG